MKQVFLKDGQAVVQEVPAPITGEDEVLVKVIRSCISIGTELAGISPGQPPTLNPESPMWTLGYSAAGVVIETSLSIHDIFRGDRVACAGAQCAHHAEYISVPRNLLVPIQEKLSFDEAAPIALGAIAMQGVRRAQPTLGECFVVIGLGLIGQITAQLLKANGCRVIGTDLDIERIRIAEEMGIDFGLNPGESDQTEKVKRLTGGTGVDGVIITASGSEDILASAFDMCRKKGRIVLVGDVKININRADIYKKELDFFISTSYGPGRYDRKYEEKEVDYPLGYVRWTENRNMEEYLRLVEGGSIKTDSLKKEIYPMDKAGDAYYNLKNSPNKPILALLSYPELREGKQPIYKIENPAISSIDTKQIRVALIGPGSFAKGVHLPNLKQHPGLYSLQAVVSRKGETSKTAAEQFGARYSTTNFQQVIDDPDVDAVFITTRHHLHKQLTVNALKAGKHVFVEKPLCLNNKQLDEIKKVYDSFDKNDAPVLLTGFNRRFSPFMQKLHDMTKRRTNPMILNYRMNAGYIPLDHWVHGEEGGGRNIGEACHIYDLFTYLTDAQVRTVQAKSIIPKTKTHSYRDNFVVTISFMDGSLATLTYTALGSTEYPKEKLEIYCDNKVFVMDNYNELTGYGTQDVHIESEGDKGHVQEIRAFAKAILERSSWPIPLWQQFQAMEIAFEVEKLLVNKRGQE